MGGEARVVSSVIASLDKYVRIWRVEHFPALSSLPHRSLDDERRGTEEERRRGGGLRGI